MTTSLPTEATEYDHVNLADIDPTFKPVDEGFYTLQVNKLTPRTTVPKSGKNEGKTLLYLSGSFTIVGDENFAGRKIWKSFWANNTVDLKDLRRLMDATGITQDAGETLSDYGSRFEALNPPAEFKVFVGIKPSYRDPSVPENVIQFNQAQPVG